MTAEWEMQLDYISRGSLSPDTFLSEISSFVSQFIEDQKVKLATQPTPFAFRSERPTIGTCPKCGKNVREYAKSWSCESGKEGCGFTIWKTIAGKNLTASQATDLLKKGETDLIRGFRSKTGKSFQAKLVLQDDYTISFSFAPPKNNRKNNR